MNENDTHAYCLLWAETRGLAMERGLEMALTCPLEEICKGTSCVLIDPKKDTDGLIYNYKDLK
jgi:hypothetical protein